MDLRRHAETQHGADPSVGKATIAPHDHQRNRPNSETRNCSTPLHREVDTGNLFGRESFEKERHEEVVEVEEVEDEHRQVGKETRTTNKAVSNNSRCGSESNCESDSRRRSFQNEISINNSPVKNKPLFLEKRQALDDFAHGNTDGNSGIKKPQVHHYNNMPPNFLMPNLESSLALASIGNTKTSLLSPSIPHFPSSMPIYSPLLAMNSPQSYQYPLLSPPSNQNSGGNMSSPDSGVGLCTGSPRPFNTTSAAGLDETSNASAFRGHSLRMPLRDEESLQDNDEKSSHNNGNSNDHQGGFQKESRKYRSRSNPVCEIYEAKNREMILDRELGEIYSSKPTNYSDNKERRPENSRNDYDNSRNSTLYKDRSSDMSCDKSEISYSHDITERSHSDDVTGMDASRVRSPEIHVDVEVDDDADDENSLNKSYHVTSPNNADGDDRNDVGGEKDDNGFLCDGYCDPKQVIPPSHHDRNIHGFYSRKLGVENIHNHHYQRSLTEDEKCSTRPAVSNSSSPEVQVQVNKFSDPPLDMTSPYMKATPTLMKPATTHASPNTRKGDGKATETAISYQSTPLDLNVKVRQQVSVQ